MLYYIRFFQAVATLSLLMLLSSCASVSVKSISRQKAAFPPVLPARIYVQDFGGDESDFRGSRPGEMKTDSAAILTERLVVRLTKHVAPAQPLGAGRIPNQSNAWLITGKFTRVNQGSRALRAVIGLGAGGSKMETTAEIFDLRAAKPFRFLTIQTTGGSNAEPGALLQGDPISATVTIIYASTSTGVTADASRTSRMITAVLSQHLYESGLIPKSRALKPKPLGRLP